MARYKIISNGKVMKVLVWRWWWPFWMLLRGWRLEGILPSKVKEWCQREIDTHKGLIKTEPEWKEVD